ncbi:MAG: DUF4348 domain-containing protein [Bacteroidaceae bacterium]|nr:DUF4348 domain-containing protein [Bacteroidaceae bacterium]
MARQKYIFGCLLCIFLVCVTACHQARTKEGDADADSVLVDIDETTIAGVDENPAVERYADTRHIDATFEDFLYAFTHSPQLRGERVAKPVIYIAPNDSVRRMDKWDYAHEFEFLNGDYFTVIYANSEEMETVKNCEDSIVRVEHIFLSRREVRTYEFQNRRDGWQMVSVRDASYEATGYGDFLDFYRQFSEDSIFQRTSLAQPLRLIMMDPDNEDSYIEGTIDAEQWFSFSPELPQGELTNIRRTQQYTGHRMIIQKCGIANGMGELYTFDHVGSQWRLVSFEN